MGIDGHVPTLSVPAIVPVDRAHPGTAHRANPTSRIRLDLQRQRSVAVRGIAMTVSITHRRCNLPQPVANRLVRQQSAERQQSISARR